MWVIFIVLKYYSFIQVIFIANLPSNMKGAVKNKQDRVPEIVTWIDIENANG